MRLGKEQAVGYVEDTGDLENAGHPEKTGADPAHELTTGQPDRMPLTPATEPAVTAG